MRALTPSNLLRIGIPFATLVIVLLFAAAHHSMSSSGRVIPSTTEVSSEIYEVKEDIKDVLGMKTMRDTCLGGTLDQEDKNPENVRFMKLLEALYKPVLHPITAPSFTSVVGSVHNLSTDNAPRFTEGIGKRLLILDVDTRPMDSPGQICSVEPPSWDSLEHLSAGIFAHRLFAEIHGYSYKFIRAPAMDGHHGTWVRVALVNELTKHYDWIVVLDADAVFTHPHLPLEWLFNYWGINSTDALSAALDPAGEPNFDSKHYPLMNCGFVITQSQAPLISEIYEAWGSCTTTDRYEDCGRWAQERFHEQRVLGEYIRYDYPSAFKEIPCNQANGFPEAAASGCTGTFLRHFWTDKTLAKRQFMDLVMSAVVPQLSDHWQKQGYSWTDKEESQAPSNHTAAMRAF